MKNILLAFLIVNLTACTLTPEEMAEREAKRIRQEQALQLELAQRCDADTADIMYEQFNPPVSRTPKELKQFEKRYVEKVSNPMFQTCYRMAWENYRELEAIRQIRDKYENELDKMRHQYQWELEKMRFHYENVLRALQDK